MRDRLLHWFKNYFLQFHSQTALDQEHNCIVRIATSEDHIYTNVIIEEMTLSAAKRGVHITPRTPGYIMEKMNAGLAVIAINPENSEWVGFCCIEVWEHGKYVANSGLIISPKYRGAGISRDIKVKLFDQCRLKFPAARLFSLSTSPAVQHVNEELGYKVIPHTQMLKDKTFLEGCTSWVNYVELMNDKDLSIRYVAMVFDPSQKVAEPALSGFRQYIAAGIKLITQKKTEPVLKHAEAELAIHPL